MATTTLGADAVVLLNALNISDFVDTVSHTSTVDSLDITTFGNNAHRKRGGLTDGTASLGGVYDTTVNGPHDVIEPLLGTVVPLVFRPEGTGSTLPETTVDVLVQSYVETAPVAEIVRWTAELEFSGDVTQTAQV
ncbi:MAG: hypothetical protein ACREA0_03675 [bacterium]